MAKPKRVQLSRQAGWKKPAGAVVVSRPSRWGNPYKLEQLRKENPALSEQRVRERMIAAFEKALRGGKLAFSVEDVRRELRGKSLCCWCPLPSPGEQDACHAAVLLAIANGK